MAFNPDQYLKEKVGQSAPSAGFDPDAYLAQKKAAPGEPSPEDLSDISQAESFIRAGIQVPTLGFADEGLGGLHALADIATTDAPMSDFEKLYTTYRDMERRKNDLASKANPKTSMAGSLTGGIATAFIPGLNAASLEGAVGTGALAGLGSSEADLTKGELGQAAKDTAIGGVLGGATQKVAGAIGGGIKGLTGSVKQAGKEYTKEGAEALYSSLNPSNAEMTNFRGLLKPKEIPIGPMTESQVSKSLEKEAEKAISLPELANKYVKFVGGPEEAENLIQQRINKIELEKAPILEKVNTLLKFPSLENLKKLSENDLKSEFNKVINEGIQSDLTLTGVKKESLSSEYNEIFKNITNSVDEKDIVGLNDIKKQIGAALTNKDFNKLAESDPNQALKKEMLTKAYIAVKNRIEYVADTVSPPGSQLGKTFKLLNKEEKNLIDLHGLASKTASSEAKSSGLGIGGGIAMSLGATAGGAIAGPVGAGIGAGVGLGGKKLIEDYLGQNIGRAAQVGVGKIKNSLGSKLTNIGNNLQAVEPALQATGKFIQDQADEGLVSGVAQRSPFKTKHDTSNLATYDDGQLGGVAQALGSTQDPQLQSYGENLNKALSGKDIQAKNAAIFLIMQNPKARKHLGLMKR